MGGGAYFLLEAPARYCQGLLGDCERGFGVCLDRNWNRGRDARIGT